VKLILKFNLILIMMFLIGLAASFYIANDLLQKNAREEIRENARIMMESALAVRAYTVSQIKPLLETQMRYQFLPQTVPSYSATEYFNNLRKSFPEYMYKEATINPTNLRDRAEGWEVDVVSHFRENADAKELIGERQGATGPILYLARPMRINDGKCLVCHSTVDAAPQTMLDQYGPANGFGWQFKDVVGAQIVSVPYTLPLQRANAALRSFLYLLVGVFVFLFVTVNFLLYTLVVNPVRRLRSIADKVSLGAMDAPEFSGAGGSEEIASLGQSFNRMRRSLVEALKMLQED
jgi:protein-histidine pros-kinase